MAHLDKSVCVSDGDAMGFSKANSECFGAEFIDYVQNESLKWSRSGTSGHWGAPLGWVFWNQQDYETTEPTLPPDNYYAELIRRALQDLISHKDLYGRLVQFWAPKRTQEGQTFLTVQGQPFALADCRFASCPYRMGMCKDHDSFHADAGCAEEQLGLPGRVFLNQFPEYNPDVSSYSLKEYPQRDLALGWMIRASWALPVFDRSNHTCIGVPEIVSTSDHDFFFDLNISGKIYDTFQEYGLQCADQYKHIEMQIRDENEARTAAFQEIKMALQSVQKIHDLPLAIAWVPCIACNDFLPGYLLFMGGEFCARACPDGFKECGCYDAKFIKYSKSCHLRKGGVAGMLLSPPNMLYCSDISKLSLAEYPFVTFARHFELCGWFAVFLQSNNSANDVYVLEFVLRDNSWTSLSIILGVLVRNLRSFKLGSGQELRDLCSFKVKEFQNGQKLYSSRKIQTRSTGGENFNLPSLEPLQSEKVIIQLDSSDHDPSVSAQDVSNAEQTLIVVANSEGNTRATQKGQRKNAGVRIDVSLDDILKCSEKSRHDAAEILRVSVSTLKRVCRDYGILRWPPRDIKSFRSCEPSPIEKHGQTRELNSGLGSNQDCASVSHVKPAFQDADIVTIRAKLENITVKFKLSLPAKLVALLEKVTARLDLEAGSYHIKYEDEDNVLISITCDEDLEDCIHTFKSLGKTCVEVLLEPR